MKNGGQVGPNRSQMSDHIGAKLTYPALPEHARTIIGDKGYDRDQYRAALKSKGIMPCIPPRKGRLLPSDLDKSLYRQRHKIENMFGKLKDWRRVHTRYDRCAQHLHVHHRNRCHRPLLARLMSPEPRGHAIRAELQNSPWPLMK